MVMAAQMERMGHSAPLLLLLLLLLLSHRLHLEVILVQPTLRLLLPPSPSPRAFPRVALAALRRAVPVSHAPIPLLRQLVVRNVVSFDVPIHEFKRPREKRVDLQQPRLVRLERL